MQTERNEIAGMLEKVTVARKPCLRRSREEDSLFATDLPLVAEAEGVLLFLNMAREKGWKTTVKNGWLLLDRVPETLTVTSRHGPEALACASLLERHPESINERTKDTVLWRQLVKACEEGRIAEERAFAGMHALLAERLRLRGPMPDIKIL